MSTARQHIGKAFRQQRLSRGLSQETLAGEAGISRTTLIQIEKGKDAQLSSVELAGQVLGLEIGVLSEAPDLARQRQARAENQARLAASREKHLRIAIRLALGGAEARRLKADALRMVRLWEDKHLCSPAYIQRWQKILDATPGQVAQNLLQMMDDEWGPALRQNTPFAVIAP